MWSFLRFGSFIRYITYTEIQKVAAFITPPTTPTSNALNQDNSQLIPEGQLPTSWCKLIAPKCVRHNCRMQ